MHMALDGSPLSHKHMSVAAMTPQLLLGNSLPASQSLYALCTPPPSWFELTNLALAQKPQNTPSTDPRKGTCQRSASLPICLGLDLPVWPSRSVRHLLRDP